MEWLTNPEIWIGFITQTALKAISGAQVRYKKS